MARLTTHLNHLFDRVLDFLIELVSDTSWFGFNPKVIILGTLLYSADFLVRTTVFVDRYVWSPPQAFYTLIAIMIADFLAAVRYHVSENTFQAKKVPRVAYKMVGYAAVLIMTSHIARYETYMAFLPRVTYGIITLSVFISFVRNITRLGMLPTWFHKEILRRIEAHTRREITAIEASPTDYTELNKQGSKPAIKDADSSFDDA